MLAPVDVDNQPRVQTNKIQYVTPEGMLSPEFVTTDLKPTQPPPQPPFRLSHAAA